MVLASGDPQYIEAVLDYVNGSEFERRVQITAFSRLEAFEKFMSQEGQRPDLIAAEPAFAEVCLHGGKEGDPVTTAPLILLSETGREEGYTQVERKFQPLPELLTALLKRAAGEDGEAALRGGEAPVQVIGVYSAAGGVGKTTTALQMARMLTGLGAKVFFLNLESVQSSLTEDNRGPQGDGAIGLGGLLYELKASAEQKRLPEKSVSRFAVKHSWTGGETFPGAANLRELLEMTKEDTIRLLDYIALNETYDFILVDMDSFVDGRSEGMLERCDRLIWLLEDDDRSMAKSAAWLTYLEHYEKSIYQLLRRKTVFVLNKFDGFMAAHLPRPEMDPAFKLPLVPDWEAHSYTGNSPESPVYKRDLMKLCRYLGGSLLQTAEDLRGWS